MGLFRRREPLHERLAREGGLGDEPIETRTPWQETGVHGLQRPREWDVTVTAEAPEIDGDAVSFVALPDRTVLVEEGPDTALEPLAAAVEQTIPPPYRARAARQSETLWAVQARRIEVIEIPDGPDGDSIELTSTDEGKTISVDDIRRFGSIPVLEERGEREGAAYVVRGERLEGDLWEIRAEPL